MGLQQLLVCRGRRWVLASFWALVLGLNAAGTVAFLYWTKQEELVAEALRDRFHLSTRKCVQGGWAPPTRCVRGQNHWSREQLTVALPAFAAVYKQRPIFRNIGGMNTNHAFALWFTARALRPKHIVESGVNRGQSTWLLRQAAGPDAWIYCLDPHPQDFLTYSDHASNRTRYFMGTRFRDLGDVDWPALIPLSERGRTLVVLDDHMAATRRVGQLLAAGFVHLWYDDNKRQDTDCYSFNQVCSPLPLGATTVPFTDNFGRVAVDIPLQEHEKNVAYLLRHMDVYFEFPPLLDGCGWDSDGALLPWPRLRELGLPSVSEDRNNYAHWHPPYVRLRT